LRKLGEKSPIPDAVLDNLGKDIQNGESMRGKGRTLLTPAKELNIKVDMGEGVQTWIVS
jgi:hypothetical protein